ncbi:MAG TPA: hypothetical protein VGP65_09815 [Candidatus Angelobacter sp.]|nr:hypothetical protein [Candidatus Angelobacter sp.]
MNEKSGIGPELSGEIAFDLVQPGNVHNLFISSPATGQISRVPNDSVFNFEQRASENIPNCYQKPVRPSPNGNFVAGCNGSLVPSMVEARPDIFLIAPTHSIAAPCPGLRGKEIVGFVWSPDSKAIAVLSSTVRVSFNPRYWFYALSGHPMQYETYYLNVIEPISRRVVSFEIPFQTSFGRAQLLSWRHR